MDSKYRGFIGEVPNSLEAVSWEVSVDEGFPWYDFMLSNGNCTISMYAGSQEDEVEELLDKLENLKEQIDSFIDAVETAEGS